MPSHQEATGVWVAPPPDAGVEGPRHVGGGEHQHPLLAVPGNPLSLLGLKWVDRKGRAVKNRRGKFESPNLGDLADKKNKLDPFT